MSIFLNSKIEGVEVLHSKKIIHKDLKPGNILLNVDAKTGEWDNENFVVTDFGISTQTDGFIPNGEGTPGFADPEQILGKPHYYSDIYSTARIIGFGCKNFNNFEKIKEN